ncbi:hypothetical protein LP316_06595 [Thalassotalea sp. LPB0316]|uniref:hypothetical protein n=1 Tax=Thalassotalea sp. LPB0316 TaxID=2769490 RepID=UPI001867E94D|nr:hypothetical protein [Thalassotalea sp. LPB0316]QOL26955.1 hypothetical protein LP316_06595 [Thalassotalea sp. LPB0316]
MSLASKGLVAQKHCSTNSTQCVIGLKHLKLILSLLMLLAFLLFGFLFDAIRLDVSRWLSFGSLSQPEYVQPVTVKNVWIKPGDYIHVGTKLMTLTIDDSTEKGKKLAHKLGNYVRQQVEYYRGQIAELKLHKRDQTSLLNQELKNVQNQLVALKYFNHTASEAAMSQQNREHHIGRLSKRQHDLTMQLRDLPLNIQEQLRVLSWLKTDLLYQLENIEQHNTYHLIAEQEGLVRHVYFNHGDIVLAKSALISISPANTGRLPHMASRPEFRANLMPLETEIGLIGNQSDDSIRTVDIKLRKAAFRYLHQ